MREEASFRMFFEKFRASKRKLEIDDPKPPKKEKVLSHYEKGEVPVESVSTVEEHYHQIFISAEILHWNSSGNGNTAFKSVAWRRFWSWTLAISLLFSNELDKFKLETQIKALKNIVDEKQEKQKNKRSNKNYFTIKCISKAVSVWSAYFDLSLNIYYSRTCIFLLIITTYKKPVDKLKLAEAASQFCFKNEHR